MGSMRRSTPRGFTLIELMVTVAIVAILLGIGVPSFQSYIANQRGRAATLDLIAALQSTRAEAVKRNANVLLSIDTNSNKDLQGWAVVSDTTKVYSDCTADPLPDYCLKVQVVQGTINISSGDSSFTYGSTGRLVTASTTTFDVCVSKADKRRVAVGSTGSPSINKVNPVVTCP